MEFVTNRMVFKIFIQLHPDLLLSLILTFAFFECKYSSCCDHYYCQYQYIWYVIKIYAHIDLACLIISKCCCSGSCIDGSFITCFGSCITICSCLCYCISYAIRQICNMKGFPMFQFECSLFSDFDGSWISSIGTAGYCIRISISFAVFPCKSYFEFKIFVFITQVTGYSLRYIQLTCGKSIFKSNRFISIFIFCMHCCHTKFSIISLNHCYYQFDVIAIVGNTCSCSGYLF